MLFLAHAVDRGVCACLSCPPYWFLKHATACTLMAHANLLQHQLEWPAASTVRWTPCQSALCRACKKPRMLVRLRTHRNSALDTYHSHVSPRRPARSPPPHTLEVNFLMPVRLCARRQPAPNGQSIWNSNLGVRAALHAKGAAALADGGRAGRCIGPGFEARCLRGWYV